MPLLKLPQHSSKLFAFQLMDCAHVQPSLSWKANFNCFLLLGVPIKFWNGQLWGTFERQVVWARTLRGTIRLAYFFGLSPSMSGLHCVEICTVCWNKTSRHLILFLFVITEDILNEAVFRTHLHKFYRICILQKLCCEQAPNREKHRGRVKKLKVVLCQLLSPDSLCFDTKYN